MAETIINSNQLRASGDTSSQTLIGANQIRQSGDSSSQTLLNKNQIAQSQGTLNVTIVGNPTISNDYILSDCSGADYLSIYLGDYIPYNTSNWKICFKIKFLSQKYLLAFDCIQDLTSTRIQFFNTDLPNNCGWLVGAGNSWINSGGPYSIDIPNLQANIWYYFKFCFDGTSYYIEYGTDGINFSRLQYFNSTYFTSFSNLTRIFIPSRSGVGDATKKVDAQLDLKETNIYINNNKVWEAVSF